MQITPLKTIILGIRAPSVKCIHRLHSSLTQHRSERQFGNWVSLLFKSVQLLFQICSPSPNYSGRPNFIKSFTQPICNCRNSNKDQEVAPGSWSELLQNMKKHPTPIYTLPLQYFPKSNTNNELGIHSHSGKSLIYPTGVPSTKAKPGIGCVKFLWLLPAKHCTFPSLKQTYKIEPKI